MRTDLAMSARMCRAACCAAASACCAPCWRSGCGAGLRAAEPQAGTGALIPLAMLARCGLGGKDSPSSCGLCKTTDDLRSETR